MELRNLLRGGLLIKHFTRYL